MAKLLVSIVLGSAVNGETSASRRWRNTLLKNICSPAPRRPLLGRERRFSLARNVVGERRSHMTALHEVAMRRGFLFLAGRSGPLVSLTLSKLEYRPIALSEHISYRIDRKQSLVVRS